MRKWVTLRMETEVIFGIELGAILSMAGFVALFGGLGLCCLWEENGFAFRGDTCQRKGHVGTPRNWFEGDQFYRCHRRQCQRLYMPDTRIGGLTP